MLCEKQQLNKRDAATSVCPGQPLPEATILAFRTLAVVPGAVSMLPSLFTFSQTFPLY